jgi:parvulin-like peptidyl-prolyl isomerase
MKAALPMRFISLLPLVFVALLFAGCGGSGGGGGGSAAKLGPNDVAVVDTTHITQSMYNDALAEEKASLKSQGQSIPSAGSTQYDALKSTVIEILVQQAEFALEATKLGITVTPAEVDKQLTALKKKYFAGSEAKYQAGLKQQGFTDAEVRTNLRQNLIEQKIFNHVTKKAKATPAEISAYYAQNLAQYQVSATRAVREILVGKNKEALANKIYDELKGGASFAALAKKYSQDPGSKDKGGTFTATQGSDVPEFDKAVFASSAKTGELLKPVKTAEYGWFVIQPLKAIVPGKQTPEKKAAPSIRKTLNQGKEEDAMNTWVNQVAKTYCTGSKISYESGFAPSPDPCATLTTSVPTTT